MTEISDVPDAVATEILACPAIYSTNVAVTLSGVIAKLSFFEVSSKGRSPFRTVIAIPIEEVFVLADIINKMREQVEPYRKTKN